MVAVEISEEAGIELEYECAFKWVAFCPMRNSESGALTRYFGKRRGEAHPEAGLGDAINKTRLTARYSLLQMSVLAFGPVYTSRTTKRIHW
ncbi:hypothetical protein [Halorubrum tropicale]|uniref:hypothetical protein n=1 Tax=Halorubrum tropicale TaxID=1765655 RepID=UPI0014322B6D